MVATGMAKRVGNGAPARQLEFELHSPEIRLPADVAQYAHDKGMAKLAKFGRRVVGVVVHVKDVNGQKRGIDKTCHMEARLAGLEPVNVEERHEDLRAAIDLAFERLEEAVHRHLEKGYRKLFTRERRLIRAQKSL
jgi:ribosome-associated translation inhibitor RaiA